MFSLRDISILTYIVANIQEAKGENKGSRCHTLPLGSEIGGLPRPPDESAFGKTYPSDSIVGGIANGPVHLPIDRRDHHHGDE
jgi:hypothetical protein